MDYKIELYKQNKTIFTKDAKLYKTPTYKECNIMSKARLIALPYRKHNFYQEYMAHGKKCHKFIQSLFIIKKALI